MTDAEINEKKTRKHNPSVHDDGRIVVMALSIWTPKRSVWDDAEKREGSVVVYPDKSATHIRDNGVAYMPEAFRLGEKRIKG